VNVVFDLDGTLADSLPDLRTAVNAVLDGAGRRSIRLDETRRFVGRGSRELLRAAFEATGGPPADLDAVMDDWLTAYLSTVAAETRLFPGAREALDRLRDTGHGLALCTNKPEAPTRVLIEALGIADHFGAAVVGGDTLPVRKPDPAPLREALARIGGPHRPAVLVGDSITDAQTARNADIAFVAVPWGYRDRSVEELGADAVLASFEELPAVVRTLTG